MGKESLELERKIAVMGAATMLYLTLSRDGVSSAEAMEYFETIRKDYIFSESGLYNVDYNTNSTNFINTALALSKDRVNKVVAETGLEPLMFISAIQDHVMRGFESNPVYSSISESLFSLVADEALDNEVLGVARNSTIDFLVKQVPFDAIASILLMNHLFFMRYNTKTNSFEEPEYVLPHLQEELSTLNRELNDLGGCKDE